MMTPRDERERDAWYAPLLAMWCLANGRDPPASVVKEAQRMFGEKETQ